MTEPKLWPVKQWERTACETMACDCHNFESSKDYDVTVANQLEHSVCKSKCMGLWATSSQPVGLTKAQAHLYGIYIAPLQGNYSEALQTHIPTHTHSCSSVPLLHCIGS